MPATASDDGVVLGLKFDISRVKQTLDQVKNMVRDMAEDSAKAVSKTDDTLEKKHEKNAEKWKIETKYKGHRGCAEIGGYPQRYDREPAE